MQAMFNLLEHRNPDSTIVIVFTIMICSCSIVIVVKFDYCPALLKFDL